MNPIRIEQIDVWTFGDGRPFEAGEDHTRTTIFPPTAMTIQGALRAKVLAESNYTFQQYKEQKDCQPIIDQIGHPTGKEYGNLRMRGPWLVKNDNRVYPLPADLVTEADRLKLLNPLRETPFKDNIPGGLLPLWVKGMGVIGKRDGWLSESDYRKYLDGDLNLEVIENHQLFNVETRFCVKINNRTKNTEKGHLYAQDFVRLCDDVCVDVDIQGLDLPETGWLALGGDARVASYRYIKHYEQNRLPTHYKQKFKIVFVTPAYFENGWLPTDWSKWFPSVKLVSAVLKRPISIGGRDVANNQPKKLRKFISPGSVFYFESNQEATRYSGDMVTEYGAEIGFGQIFIGEWDYV